MADFALGLTKTALSSTLSRVQSAIEEEAELRVTVQRDLVFITGEFQMMRSFLKVVSKERADTEVVKTWVRQLRDLAFDVEDCVEFVVHLDKKKKAWWWRAAPSCMAPPLQLDEAAAEIKQLKARVEDVIQRNSRYSLIVGDSGAHTTPVPPSDQTAATTGADGSDSRILLAEIWEASGRLRGTCDLGMLIAGESSDDLQVISLWRSREEADLGYIIRKVYCDPEIGNEFQCRAWVKLVHPFNPDEFLKSLLSQFYASSHLPNVDLEHLTKPELMQQVTNLRYLVVLEGLSTVAEPAWDIIRMYLPDRKRGSRIVVSTQHLEVALLCTGEPYRVSKLRRSDDQSLFVFFKQGYGLRSQMGEFIWQLTMGPGGVTFVYVGGLKEVVDIIRDDQEKQLTYRWVDMCGQLDLSDFSYYLLEREEEEDREEEQIQACRDFLLKDKCLVVINNVSCSDVWDDIQRNFFPDQPPNASILVVTRDESVAKYWADHESRVFSQKDVNDGYHYLLKVKETKKKSRWGEAGDWLKNDIMVGREKENKDLMNSACLCNGISSVWGIAGVGKSDLVRSMYYERMLSGQFSAFSWVDVPQSFSLTEFSRHMLLDFHSDDIQAKEAAALGIMQGQDPIKGCCKIFHEESCFVVIDGLRSTHDWDLIKTALFSGTTSHLIVVVTTMKSIAMHCVDQQQDRILNVKGLRTDLARALVDKELWRSTPLDPHKRQLSELIVAKCGGLPKVIAATLAEREYILSASAREVLAGVTPAEMTFDLMGLFRSGTSSNILRGLFSWIHTHFDNCSDSLKPCIFYLSVFSINEHIARRRLLRRWIAEGYCIDTSACTAEENAEKFFSELIDLSIILVQQLPSKVVCQVNGFFREYIISRPMEDNLVFALEGCCTQNLRRTGKHLSIRSTWDRDRIMFESIDFSRLRSLTVSGEWRSFFFCTDLNIRRLRVLDLEGTVGLEDGDLQQIVELVPRLKFLSLRGCKDITRLPHSLGGLRQLQTLDVRHTSVVKLPSTIIKLLKLQCIHAGATAPADEDWTSTPSEQGYGTARTSTPSSSMPHTLVSRFCKLLRCRIESIHNGGVEVPAGIENLTALHTIGVVNIDVAGGKAILEELKKLTQLCKLKLSGINRGNIQKLYSLITSHGYLESLSMWLDEDMQDFFGPDDLSQPPKALQTLKLHGYIGELPAWINKLHNLKKLYVEMIIPSQQEGYHFLDQLPLPERIISGHLSVRPTQDCSKLSFVLPENYRGMMSNFQFTVLKIDYSSMLNVTFGRGVASSVELLKIHCSSGLSLNIFGLQHLKNLKQVWLMGSCTEELKKGLRNQLAGHGNKPELLLEKPRSS